VQHAHCEPEFPERIAELVKRLDDDSFAVRAAAQKDLEALGPAAAVHLARLRKGATSAEVVRRIDELLARWEAREAFGR
jgi:HEAT repeat protein